MSGTLEVCIALRKRLTDAAPGCAIAASLVAWENVKFTPVAGTRYYRATFLPGTPRAAAIGSDAPNRHVGLFQVDIFDPVGRGDNATAAEAERIAACYKRGTVLTYSGVTVRAERSWVSRVPQDDPAWYRQSVRVEWRADVPN
ncbi:MAG: hypothetical protein JNG85_13180 [Spirochaetaceae bacterium]|nr:hypothetical protein [Spirochaetaceae bacterium]